MSYDINKLVEKVVNEVKSEAASKQPATKKVEMSLALARRLVEKVKLKAKEIGVNAVVAVSDKGANVITVDCMDGAYIASLDIAMNKAFTSVSLKMPTSALAKLARPDGPLYGIQNTNNGRIVIFGGGVPLESNGEIIGGLGVSGGSAEQDTYLGDYGKEIFAELVKIGE